MQPHKCQRIAWNRLAQCAAHAVIPQHLPKLAWRKWKEVREGRRDKDRRGVEGSGGKRRASLGRVWCPLGRP